MRKMRNRETAGKDILTKEKNVDHIRYAVLLGGILIMFIAQLLINPALVSSGLAFSDYVNKTILSIVSVALISAPATLAMVSGYIDLSVGSILMLSATISCTIISRGTTGLDTVWAIICPLLVGLGCGLLNGVLVGGLGLGPFITTLGTSYLFLGMGVLYNGGSNVTAGSPPAIYEFIGSGKLFGIFPFPIVMVVLVFLVFGFLLHCTNYGRKVYAIGGNSLAAHYSGIHSKRIAISVYALVGVMSGYAGLFVSAWTKTADNTMGTGREFNVIMAMILGGAQMTGGAGSAFGTALGVLFIGVLERLYVQFDIAMMYQYIIKGALLIIVVYINFALEKLNERRAAA